jgi:seryl-tRNA synthetase
MLHLVYHITSLYYVEIIMLDIKFIRENKDLVKEAARKKNIPVDIDNLLSLDDTRLSLLRETEDLRARQNTASDEIAKIGADLRAKKIAEMKVLKEKLSQGEEKLKSIMDEWRRLMISVPNIPDASVPEGKNDEENVELRTEGEIPKFSFTPKNHVELMKNLNLADFERGSKVSGFRGYFLTGDALSLSFALWSFTLSLFSKKGFTLLSAPSLVKKEGFWGTGYLPQGEEDLYKTQDETYLTGTAEVPVMASFMDEVFEKKNLPKKILAFSPCFRREAGSYGKDTKGIIRVHEFFKLEQVVLCEASHEVSVSLHEEITKNAEELMQALKIPYRVVVNCGGDLGLGQVKKYDIEAWVPSEGKYRETHSSSYFHDFQTRRLNIKYKDTDGKVRFAHSLNNTACATPRLLVPLLENGQEKDGSIRIPEVLRPYMGKDFIKPK